MALAGTYELLPIHTRHFSPRPLELRIGEPILTTGLIARQSEALTTQLRQAIQELRLAPPSRH
jgi:1-acyl-sn-glycerol-3-phosphate acyltransferase